MYLFSCSHLLPRRSGYQACRRDTRPTKGTSKRVWNIHRLKSALRSSLCRHLPFLHVCLDVTLRQACGQSSRYEKVQWAAAVRISLLTVGYIKGRHHCIQRGCRRRMWRNTRTASIPNAILDFLKRQTAICQNIITVGCFRHQLLRVY